MAHLLIISPLPGRPIPPAGPEFWYRYAVACALQTHSKEAQPSLSDSLSHYPLHLISYSLTHSCFFLGCMSFSAVGQGGGHVHKAHYRAMNFITTKLRALLQSPQRRHPYLSANHCLLSMGLPTDDCDFSETPQESYPFFHNASLEITSCCWREIKPSNLEVVSVSRGRPWGNSNGLRKAVHVLSSHQSRLKC